MVDEYTARSSLVLDVGCGPNGGHIVAPLISFEGIGLDVSRANIEKSNLISKVLRAARCQYVRGDVSKMPFRHEIFDIIICRDVVEHVRDKGNAFREMALSLNHRGKVLISTTNAFNPALFLDGVLPKRLIRLLITAFGGGPHYEREKRLNPWTLTGILSENGLSLDKLLMVGFPPIGRAWKYRDSKTKPPGVFYVWKYFNKFTDVSPFRILKENMLAVATRSFISSPSAYCQSSDEKCDLPIDGAFSFEQVRLDRTKNLCRRVGNHERIAGQSTEFHRAE